MRGQTRQCLMRILFRHLETRAVALEPQYPIGQHAGCGQPTAQALGNGAEILADDQAAVALAFDGGDGKKRFQGKLDISAEPPLGAFGHPELPRESQHMIDPQRRRMAHVGGKDIAHRLIVPRGERQRREGWKTPHLASARERIGGSADRHACGKISRRLGDFAAIEGAAQRQIAVEIIMGSGAKLHFGQPLQEGAVGDARWRNALAGKAGLELSMTLERASPFGDKGVEGRIAFDFTEGGFENDALCFPHARVIDVRQLVERGKSSLGFRRQRFRLGESKPLQKFFDADVDGIDIAPVRWLIGAGAAAVVRKQMMQRVEPGIAPADCFRDIAVPKAFSALPTGWVTYPGDILTQLLTTFFIVPLVRVLYHLSG